VLRTVGHENMMNQVTKIVVKNEAMIVIQNVYSSSKSLQALVVAAEVRQVAHWPNLYGGCKHMNKV
jgi:hypothetical protein